MAATEKTNQNRQTKLIELIKQNKIFEIDIDSNSVQAVHDNLRKRYKRCN